MCGKELKNSTVGIFGLGRVGKAVAIRLAAFAPSCIIYSSSGNRPGGYKPVPLFTRPDGTQIEAEPVSFEELLRKSDLLCVCAALNEGLKGVFNDEVGQIYEIYHRMMDGLVTHSFFGIRYLVR